MNTLHIKVAPVEGATEDEIEDALNGILQVTAEEVPNGTTAKLEKFEIVVETDVSEEEVKRILKKNLFTFL